MSNSDADHDTQFQSLARAAGLVVSACAAWATIVVVIYLLNFRKQKISDDVAAWGQLGDYIGGLINPVVGLGTVFLVVVSISIQRRELQASLAELKRSNESSQRQNFEQTLFALLNTYHALLDQLDFRNFKSRDALRELYKNFLSPVGTYQELGYKGTKEATDDLFARLRQLDDSPNAQFVFEKFDKVQDIFSSIYRERRDGIGPAVMTIVRLLQWIDRSEISASEKRWYMDLVGDQLSWAERAFLIYAGLTHWGSAIGPLANKYHLFDTFEPGNDAMLSAICYHFHKHSPLAADGVGARAWPYQLSAFSKAAAT